MKNRLPSLSALLVIWALIGAGVGFAVDKPEHLLKPDPNCALCQANSISAMKSSALIIPNLCPQVFYGIELTPNIQFVPALVHTLSIRGPPFFSFPSDLTV